MSNADLQSPCLLLFLPSVGDKILQLMDNYILPIMLNGPHRGRILPRPSSSRLNQHLLQLRGRCILSLVPRPSIRAEGGYSTKFLSTAEFRRYESDWSIRVTRYSHQQIPTQMSHESASTSYLHVLSEFLCRYIVCHGLYKRQGSCCCWDDARVAVSANNHGSLSRGETSVRRRAGR